MSLIDRILQKDWGTAADALCTRKPRLCRVLRWIAIAIVVLVLLSIARCAFGADMVDTCDTPALNCTVHAVKATPDTLTFNNAGQQCWVNTAPSPCAFRKLSAMAPTDQVLACTAGADGKCTSAEAWLPVAQLTIAASNSSKPPISRPAGKVTITWTIPTQNVLGGALTDVTGYNVYQGTSAADLKSIATVAPGVALYSTNVSAGSYVFALSTSTTGFGEGGITPLLPVTITAPAAVAPKPPGNPQISVTVTVPAPSGP